MASGFRSDTQAFQNFSPLAKAPPRDFPIIRNSFWVAAWFGAVTTGPLFAPLAKPPSEHGSWRRLSMRSIRRERRQERLTEIGLKKDTGQILFWTNANPHNHFPRVERATQLF